jgi:DNA-directed RNA polymerase specialized sigma24 family protein
MPRPPQLVDKRVLEPAQTALALEIVSKMELLRLKTIARLYARGLPPDVAWDDLLQEAITRIISGARRRPEDADDAVILKIIVGLGQGLSAEQIRLAIGLSKLRYESARRRMRRSLLREGLTCEPK